MRNNKLIIKTFCVASLCGVIASLTSCGNSDRVTSGATVEYEYQISAHLDRPNRVEFALHLPKSDASDPVRIFSRASKMNIVSQVQEVACGGQNALQIKKGTWEIPLGCRTVTWHVNAADFGSSGLGPADQQTFSMGTWWIISGPSSLLRVASSQAVQSKVRLINPDGTEEIKRLPPLTVPPAFYLLGDAPEYDVSSGASALSYVVDDYIAVTSYVEPDRHAAALRYFDDILEQKETRYVPRLRVVWFGVPQDKHEISGAAGYDTLLANYILPEENPDPYNFYRPFILVLHEQFHQLQNGVSTKGGRPAWVGESLAQYYALKAGLITFPDNEAIRAIYDDEIYSEITIEVGLLTVQHQIDVEQNYQNYSLFYSQGVHFWAEIDRSLKEASDNETDLDTLLPDILTISFASSDELPEEFIEIFSPIEGHRLDTLIQQYLLGPNG
jgi:hypothetical protein